MRPHGPRPYKCMYSVPCCSPAALLLDLTIGLRAMAYWKSDQDYVPALRFTTFFDILSDLGLRKRHGIFVESGKHTNTLAPDEQTCSHQKGPFKASWKTPTFSRCLLQFGHFKYTSSLQATSYAGRHASTWSSNSRSLVFVPCLEKYDSF